MRVGDHHIHLGHYSVHLTNPETRLTTFVVADPVREMYQAVIPDNRVAFLVRLRLMQQFITDGVSIADSNEVLSLTIRAGEYIELMQNNPLSQAMQVVTPGIESEYYVRRAGTKIANLAVAIREDFYALFIELQILNDVENIESLKEELLSSIKIQRIAE